MAEGSGGGQMITGKRCGVACGTLPLASICLLILISCLSLCAADARSAAPDSLPVASVEVKGLYSLSGDELLSLLGIRKGETLNRTAVGEGIRRAFLKGIFDDIVVESVDKAGTSVRVTVREKRKISFIKVEGNDHFSARFVKRTLGVRKGDRLNIQRLNEGMANIRSEFSRRGFANASVAYRVIPEKKNRAGVSIEVREGQPEIIREISISEPGDAVRSRLRLSNGDIYSTKAMEALSRDIKDFYRKSGYVGTVLSYAYKEGTLSIKLDTGSKLSISFAGNSNIASNKLSKEVPFFEVNEYSEDLLEETTARITALYHKAGYPFAQVAPVKSASEHAIKLEFFIFEGEKYVVDSVEFEGLTIPYGRPADILQLRKGGDYNPDLLEQDTESVSDLYRALGYLYADVQEPEIRMEANKVKIKYFVNEGPQVVISDISIKGGGHLTEADILKALPVKKGQPYNEVDISEARRKILELYNRRGFLDAMVTVEREISGITASLTFNVREGEVTRFGKAVIAGNERTRDRVLRREFLHKQGEPVDYGLLLNERQRLYRLGLFSDIDISMLEKEGDTRDILYRVREANAGAVEFGLGYGEYERYRGFIDLSYRDLFGLGKQGSFRIELSTLEQRYILSYSEPHFLKKDLAFRTLLMHENRKERNIDTGEITYKLMRETVTSGVEKKISDTLKSEFYYDFSVVKTSDVKPDVVLTREDTGTLIISGIRPGLIYDTRDNPFDPRKGLLAGLSLKVATGVLFSQTDFVKVLYYVNKYIGLDKRTVFAVSLRGGIANGFSNTRELPIVERFFLGGRTTVRGYDQDTLGPKGSDGTPTGGNAFLMGNFELRTDVGKGLGLVSFVDWGNVWRKMEDTSLSDLKYTTGIGLRYNTPVGPLRVDYGFKLNREHDESKGALHFSIGHAF